MHKKALFNMAFYLLLFFIVFFLSAIVFSQVILKGETVTVPDLTGKTVSQARMELAKKDLAVAQHGSEFNDRWDRGLIIKQDPAPDSKIRVTKVIQVITSAGSQNVRVPDLENKSLETVLSVLQGSGLTKGRITQIHSRRYPAGRVIDQKPAPDEVVERNAQVGLLISQGAREQQYVMPDLIGRKADGVIARLKEIDFRISDIHYVYYPGLMSGVVVRQFPPNGYRIQKRNLITLEVSR
jgi:beta-lactam-binding protein with PASTA domain